MISFSAQYTRTQNQNFVVARWCTSFCCASNDR